MKRFTTSVQIKTEFQALHSWPGAPDPRAYLRNTHYHDFVVNVWCNTERINKREIEFHDLRQVTDIAVQTMFTLFNQTEGGMAILGSASCEWIAQWLFVKIEETYPSIYGVSVSEEGRYTGRVDRSHEPEEAKDSSEPPGVFDRVQRLYMDVLRDMRRVHDVSVDFEYTPVFDDDGALLYFSVDPSTYRSFRPIHPRCTPRTTGRMGRQIEWEDEKSPSVSFITTVCGSTKFKAETQAVVAELELEGFAVFSVGSFMHADNVSLTPDQKADLDRLHLRKIAESDSIYVVNVGGYIGESTAREIAYAAELGLPIRYWTVEKEGTDAGKSVTQAGDPRGEVTETTPPGGPEVGPADGVEA